jgi:hypothetical protein
MRILTITLLAGLASLSMMILFSGQSLAQSGPVLAPFLAAGTTASLGLGDAASVPFLLVKGGHGHGMHGGHFRGGFLWGYPGYGLYGSYPGYGYSGSYLDTPTRTCVWNGYEYSCYNFPNETYVY